MMRACATHSISAPVSVPVPAATSQTVPTKELTPAPELFPTLEDMVRFPEYITSEKITGLIMEYGVVKIIPPQEWTQPPYPFAESGKRNCSIKFPIRTQNFPQTMPCKMYRFYKQVVVAADAHGTAAEKKQQQEKKMKKKKRTVLEPNNMENNNGQDQEIRLDVHDTQEMERDDGEIHSGSQDSQNNNIFDAEIKGPCYDQENSSTDFDSDSDSYSQYHTYVEMDLKNFTQKWMKNVPIFPRERLDMDYASFKKYADNSRVNLIRKFFKGCEEKFTFHSAQNVFWDLVHNGQNGGKRLSVYYAIDVTLPHGLKYVTDVDPLFIEGGIDGHDPSVPVLYQEPQTQHPPTFNKLLPKDAPCTCFTKGARTKVCATHAWYTTNINTHPRSLLKDAPPLPGLTIPMCYVGSLFSRFAWHVEDENLYSISYLHHGCAKIWYVVPPKCQQQVREIGFNVFDDAIRDIDPASFNKKTTIFHPSLLLKKNIPVTVVEHTQRSFVITGPGAYHCGFNMGFNVAEAVNMAWMPWVNQCQHLIINAWRSNLTCTLPLQWMVLNIIERLYQECHFNKFSASLGQVNALVDAHRQFYRYSKTNIKKLEKKGWKMHKAGNHLNLFWADKKSYVGLSCDKCSYSHTYACAARCDTCDKTWCLGHAVEQNCLVHHHQAYLIETQKMILSHAAIRRVRYIYRERERERKYAARRSKLVSGELAAPSDSQLIYTGTDTEIKCFAPQDDTEWLHKQQEDLPGKKKYKYHFEYSAVLDDYEPRETDIMRPTVVDMTPDELDAYLENDSPMKAIKKWVGGHTNRRVVPACLALDDNNSSLSAPTHPSHDVPKSSEHDPVLNHDRSSINVLAPNEGSSFKGKVVSKGVISFSSGNKSEGDAGPLSENKSEQPRKRRKSKSSVLSVSTSPGTPNGKDKDIPSHGQSERPKRKAHLDEDSTFPWASLQNDGLDGPKRKSLRKPNFLIKDDVKDENDHQNRDHHNDSSGFQKKSELGAVTRRGKFWKTH